jgi:nitrite reductase (NADH) small subunit
VIKSSIKSAQVNQWVTVCTPEQILLNTGVCALVGNQQVAIFRTNTGLYAIDNYDPFSKAYVLSRGIVGDRQGTPKVASPIYKQNFNLQTGECLDDPHICVATYPIQVVDNQVQIGVS